MLGGIGAGGQAAIHCCLGQLGGIVNHRLDRLLHGLDGAAQLTGFILGLGILEIETEVALGHLVGGLENFAQRPGDAAGDEEAQQHGQCGRHRSQGNEQVAGGFDNLLGFLAGLGHQVGLEGN